MTEPLLEINNLSIQFNGQQRAAVKNISLSIAAGKTLGLVGESGSGKSVTALSILRLIQPRLASIQADSLMFNDTNLLSLSEKQMRAVRGNQIAMVFQEPMTSLNPVFRVGTQITEALKAHQKITKKMARKKAIELLNQVGLDDPKRQIDAYPHQLSGGQKQRVMIAMAIACKPALLICDEPTTALDVTIQKQVLELLKSLQKTYQMSMLFITHDLAVIADLADEVAVMYQGHIVEQQATEQLFKNPQHPYTKGLLACRPRLHQTTRRLLTVSDFMNNVDPTVQISTAETKHLEPNGQLSSSEVLVKVENLSTWFADQKSLFGRAKSFKKAVDDVSFSVKRGETLGLVGESGSGKTTLGRTILRLQEATSGQVYYDQVNLMQLSNQQMRTMRSRMQIIFQDPFSALNPRMAIAQAIAEPMALHQNQLSRQELVDQSVILLEKVGLDGSALNKLPHQFSGGQRQRICIARALAVQPEFIVCDESVSALDVSIQAQIINLLLDLQDELDLTYIFISHDLSIVNFIANRVAVMHKGQIIELDSAEKIYHNPQHEYTQKLLDAIPSTPLFDI